jgi:hypothetical protein
MTVRAEYWAKDTSRIALFVVDERFSRARIWHAQEGLRMASTSQKEFWNWFSQHEGELFDFEAEQERIFNQLAVELQKVDPSLTFEFGPKEARREFVISAGGIKGAFPAVSALADVAPRLERWCITAFRPRRTPPNIVEFRGKRVDPKDVQFSLLDNGKSAGIYLFIPGFEEGDPEFKQIGYLLLDDTLGEYDVEIRLGLIKMLPPEAHTEGQRFTLFELPARFDQLISRLERRSGKPS